MFGQRVKQLTESIRNKQFIRSISSKCEVYSHEQALTKLKTAQQSHDDLLNECLSLIQLLDQSMALNSQQYNILTEQLEKQKLQRQSQTKQLQENINFTDFKLNELRSLINQTELQNTQLRAAIEEKDLTIQHLQVQYKSQITKINQNFNQKLLQQIETLYKNAQVQQQTKVAQLKQQIKKLYEENQVFLQQNQLLSNRLEQLIKHIKQIQAEHIAVNQITPKIIGIYKQNSASSSSSQQIYSPPDSPNRIEDFPSIEDHSSIGSETSRDRIVLRQILNTQDRKSNNYGEIPHSKDRFYHQISNKNDQNNCNIMNILSKTHEKAIQQRISMPIKQFNAISVDSSPMNLNPYSIFFTLITQCVKINCGNLEAASAVDLTPQWNTFLINKIPLHQWYPILQQKILVEIQKTKLN